MTKSINPKSVVRIVCKIDEVCQDNGISVYAMAKSMDMHPNQMYSYTSNRALPNLVTALLIAKTLNTSVENLWTMSVKKNK
jgi:DNA-binding XRE family transcriptional regulator